MSKDLEKNSAAQVPESHSRSDHEVVDRLVSELTATRKEVARLSAILDQAAVSILITDLKGRIEYVNPFFEKETGFKLEEVRGKNPRILKSGSHSVEFYSEMWRLLTSGQVWRGRLANRRRDGSIYSEEATIFPIKNEQNEIINYAAVKVDISFQLQAENSLRQSRDQVQKAFVNNRRELDMLATMHSKLLPLYYPPMGGLSIAGQCRPCADMGGDFYYVTKLADDRIAICIADVSGHGTKAAIATATCRALLCASLHQTQHGESPADVLSRIHPWLEEQLDDDQFVTAWLGIYNPSDGTLEFSSAAHPASILQRYRSEPFFMEQENSLPLGIAGIELGVPPIQKVTLEKGDRIVLYTDGWVESTMANGSVFAEQGFLDLVANAEGVPTFQVPISIFMDFERHLANSNIRDDLTLLLFDRVE
jgi:phosphoserine phosphatase RsbU/P